MKNTVRIIESIVTRIAILNLEITRKARTTVVLGIRNVRLIVYNFVD